MIDLQTLKDIDDIDHLTLEKIEANAHKNTYHFEIRRIAPEGFSVKNAIALLKHIELWYPETAKIVKKTDFTNADSVYNSLRKVREEILNSIS